MQEIKVGLIGYGMAGRVFHAPVIAAVAGLRLTKVVERRSETARARYPWVEIVRVNTIHRTVVIVVWVGAVWQAIAVRVTCK